MLTASEIHLQRDGHTLLRHARLQIAPGQVHALLGANGAGKSTLLSVLAGPQPPQRGQVQINGETMASLPLLERARRRAVVSQQDRSEGSMRAWDSVALGRFPYQDEHSAGGQAAIEQALRQTGSLGLANRELGGLSGGERARVQLARALAQLDNRLDEPRYLLLDEPTASLDLAWQHRSLRRLRHLANEGLGVLIILHDPNLALRYADTVTLLRHGTVVDSGPTPTVMQEALLSELYDLPLRRAAPLGQEMLIPLG